MNDLESMSIKDLRQHLEDILSQHKGYTAQVSHPDTPTDLKAKFKLLDKELNKNYVQAANLYYRKKNLRFCIPDEAWDKIQDS